MSQLNLDRGWDFLQALQIKLDLAMYLNGDSVRPQLATVAHLLVDLAVPLGESPLLRDVDLRKDRVCV